MNYFKERIIWIVLALIASYLLATHYAFQWYLSILLGIIVLAIIVGLNWFINKRAKEDLAINEYRIFIFALVVVIFAVGSNYQEEVVYSDCAYPPFELVSETKIPADLMIQDTFYFEDEDFTGYVTEHEYYFQAYDTVRDDFTLYPFSYVLGSEIHDITYFGGFIYISGYHLDADANYSLYKFDVRLNRIEQIMTSNEIIEVNAYADSLFLTFDTMGQRTTNSYDGEFNLIESVPVEFDFIYRVDTINDMDVVQRQSGIFLYRDDSLVGEFEPRLGDYDARNKFIYYQDEKFYLSQDFSYYTDVFDENANYLYTDETVELISYNNYILYTDYYMIQNYRTSYSSNDIYQSIVLDQYGETVCRATSQEDMKILYKNQQLYGIYENKVYEIRELNYTVPIQYENPQHGFIYSWSIAMVAFLVVRKKNIFL